MNLTDSFVVVDSNRRRVWPGAFYASSLECYEYIVQSGRNDLRIMHVGSQYTPDVHWKQCTSMSVQRYTH